MLRYILLVLSLLIIACGDDEPETLPNNIDSSPYYPIDNIVREYQVFQVDIYNSGQNRDTFNYFLRETPVGLDQNSAGQDIAIIEQSTKVSTTAPYEIWQRVTDQVISGQAIRTEGNISQIKLSLPPEKDVSWMGNERFDQNILVTIGTDEIAYYKDWESTYLSIDDKVTIDSDSYSDVLTVQHANFENRLEYRYSIEHYALGIGLIYRETRVFDTQCFVDCETQEWELKAETGQIIIQSIVSHLNE